MNASSPDVADTVHAPRSSTTSVAVGAHSITLTDILAQHRRSTPERVASVCGGRRLTYAEFDQRVDALAEGLADLGVHAGDRLLWLGQNCHRLIEATLAAGRLGAMFCPVNWRLSPSEVQFVLDDLHPTVVFFQERDAAQWVEEIRDGDRAPRVWVSADEPEAAGQEPADPSYERLIEDHRPTEVRPHVPVPDTTPVLLIYTAAFAGTPEAAMLTHQNLIAQSGVTTAVAGIDRHYAYLNCGPLFHLGTLQFTFATLVAGGKNVYIPRAEVTDICEAISNERCTGAFILGPTIAAMVEANSDGRYDLSSLRIPLSDNESWSQMTSPEKSAWERHWSGYGQTELTGLVTYNAIGHPSAGEHGRPSPITALRIVDVDNNEVARGEAGEITVRGPVVCAGYYNRPTKNAEKTRGGWWHTGDLGTITQDGSLQFVGPATRMIKSAAENIYPAEVEGALESHSSVREVAVIGVPDPTWVQSIHAIVVLHEGADVGIDELITHCRSRLASYKKPRVVIFRDTPLPRSGFAKDYDSLDAEYGGGNYPGAGAPTALD